MRYCADKNAIKRKGLLHISDHEYPIIAIFITQDQSFVNQNSRVEVDNALYFIGMTHNISIRQEMSLLVNI